MKVVFDTNVYISGLLFKGGIPSRLLDLARSQSFDLFLSPEISREINRVLLIKFELDLHERDRLLRFIEGAATVVYPKLHLDLIPACPADNRILECAVEAEADYLVTGDKKHLLPLRHTLPFQILSPSAFFERWMRGNEV